jgi:transcriptional regulator with XRE-family HTH domain
MYPNLKLAIFKKGVHQNHLSKVLGINEANLSKIIRGYREPSESQRGLLANYLDADVAWLFEKYETAAQTGRSESSEAQPKPVESGSNSESRHP